ncbi:MAG: peroxide stress protein YaaA [Bacteroidota bacterium]
MITILSPAKKLDEENQFRSNEYTIPRFLEDAKVLVDELRELDPDQLAELMNVSRNLAELNYERYLRWKTPFTPLNARHALFIFKGQAYQGLRAEDFTEDDVAFAQNHLRILSGLYGLLRPLDLIQPYRLEMGTALQNPRGKDLYEFWNVKITQTLNEALSEHQQKVLLNLASNEYFKSIHTDALEVGLITPVFKEQKGDQYKTIAVYAKKARGMMTRYIIQNRIDDPQEIKGFDWEGYLYSPEMSSENKWVFIR